MTYEEVREYVKERGSAADNMYLIDAIEDHCSDPATRELIRFWFETKDHVSY